MFSFKFYEVVKKTDIMKIPVIRNSKEVKMSIMYAITRSTSFNFYGGRS